MDQPSTSESTAPLSVHERRPEDENNEDKINPATVAEVVKDVMAQADSNLPDSIGATIECFEHIFDYLLRKDLIAVARYCKYLSNVAGHYFYQNYPAKPIWLKQEEVRCFPQFIRYLSLIADIQDWEANIQDWEEHIQDFVNIQTNFHRLKRIDLVCNEVNCSESMIQTIKETLSKLEHLEMRLFVFDGDCIRRLISASHRIKHLYYKIASNLYHSGPYGIVRNFPVVKCQNLEHLHLNLADTCDEHRITDFIEFNPTIRKLTIIAHSSLLNDILNRIRHTNIALMDLAIANPSYGDDDQDPDHSSLINLLVDLYQNGHFKRLHLYYLDEFSGKLAPLNEMIVKLDMNGCGSNTDFSAFNTFSNLSELRLGANRSEIDYEHIVINLPNLEKVLLGNGLFDAASLFICKAEKLNKIKVGTEWRNDIQGGVHYNEHDKIIDLAGLNKERQKLAEGRDLKVTIYVGEEIYVATKWARKGNTSCGLIRLERHDSCDLESDFYDF